MTAVELDESGVPKAPLRLKYFEMGGYAEAVRNAVSHYGGLNKTAMRMAVDDRQTMTKNAPGRLSKNPDFEGLAVSFERHAML
jgi:hypothetical protein